MNSSPRLERISLSTSQRHGEKSRRIYRVKWLVCECTLLPSVKNCYTESWTKYIRRHNLSPLFRKMCAPSMWSFVPKMYVAQTVKANFNWWHSRAMHMDSVKKCKTEYCVMCVRVCVSELMLLPSIIVKLYNRLYYELWVNE